MQHCSFLNSTCDMDHAHGLVRLQLTSLLYVSLSCDGGRGYIVHGDPPPPPPPFRAPDWALETDLAELSMAVLNSLKYGAVPGGVGGGGGGGWHTYPP